LEESGLPLPVPSDVAILLAGSEIGRGQLNPLAAFLAAELAAVVGGSVLYTIARRGGRPLLHRFSRLVRIKPEHLDRAEAAVQRDGLRAVMVGRWIPGMRILTVIAAGSLGVPYRSFLIALTISSAVYLGVLFTLGAVFGPTLLDHLKLPQVTWGLPRTP